MLQVNEKTDFFSIWWKFTEYDKYNIVAIKILRNPWCYKLMKKNKFFFYYAIKW